MAVRLHGIARVAKNMARVRQGHGRAVVMGRYPTGVTGAHERVVGLGYINAVHGKHHLVTRTWSSENVPRIYVLGWKDNRPLNGIADVKEILWGPLHDLRLQDAPIRERVLLVPPEMVPEEITHATNTDAAFREALTQCELVAFTCGMVRLDEDGMSHAKAFALDAASGKRILVVNLHNDRGHSLTAREYAAYLASTL